MLFQVMLAVGVVILSVRVYVAITAGRCSSTRSMTGKTVIVTGATAGIGRETARDLLRRGARVIIACRNLKKGVKVASELRSDVGGVGEVVVRHLELSDLASVRSFAKVVLDEEKAIHVLVNNAGIFGPDKRQVTTDGLELTMATNYYGHFLLTNLLLGRLKESSPSRIINVSSGYHTWSTEGDLNDLALLNKYTPWHAYSVSKLCKIIFTRELADRITGTGEDAATGAQTTIHLAVSEEMEGVTGRFYADCKEEAITGVACRKDLATDLWRTSVKTVGLEEHEIQC